MKKAINSTNNMTIGAFVIATMLSAPAIAGERQEPSGQPFLKLQQQIDVLNKCRQPVLTRIQVELLQRWIANLLPGDSLRIALLDPETGETILRHLLENADSLDLFWENVEHDRRITKAELYELRLTLFLGRLTQYQLPLLLQLKQLRQVENLITLRDVSTVTRDKWRELLAHSGAGMEPDLFIRSVDKVLDDLLFGGCN